MNYLKHLQILLFNLQDVPSSDRKPFLGNALSTSTLLLNTISYKSYAITSDVTNMTSSYYVSPSAVIDAISSAAFTDKDDII